MQTWNTEPFVEKKQYGKKKKSNSKKPKSSKKVTKK
jgi:hypothetical protein